MHDEVRVPSDRRGEVGVARRRQSEVPSVLNVIPCLLHRPEHQEGHGALLWLATQALQQALEVSRGDAFGRCAETVPK